MNDGKHDGRKIRRRDFLDSFGRLTAVGLPAIALTFALQGTALAQTAPGDPTPPGPDTDPGPGSDPTPGPDKPGKGRRGKHGRGRHHRGRHGKGKHGRKDGDDGTIGGGDP
jgi:hypothetical protein